jgi:hypothetical protein
VFFSSGCLKNFNITDESFTYESHPIQIQYKIEYGYYINCSGNGKYDISYNCELPDEILIGYANSKLLYNNDFSEIHIAGNSMIKWYISGNNDCSYKLGVISNITSMSYVVNDLKGTNALTLSEIKNMYPAIYKQYTKDQYFNNSIYIEPSNPCIRSIGQKIVNSTTNNSFLIAKNLFNWLKQNTYYQINILNSDVQPAIKTLNVKKGDCDDLSFLYISLCRSIGIPARFIRGFLLDESYGNINPVSHAWVEVFVGGNIGQNGWIPVECACSSLDTNIQINQNFGLETAYHLRLFKDNGSNESLNLSISGPSIEYDKNLDIEMTHFVKITDYNVIDSKELHIDENENRYYQ